MTFSVIIPTWRDDQRLANCLQSLFNQKYSKKFEIILASKKKLKIKNKKVSVLKINNRINHVQARNVAEDKARGKILAFCDDDCILPKNWLSVADSYFTKNKADLIGGPVVPPKNGPFSYRLSGYLTGSRFAVGYAAPKFTIFREKEAEDSDLILANTFIRKSVFKKLGGFNKYQVPCEENLLYYRAKKENYKLLYVPKIACTHPAKPIFLPLASKIFFYSTGRGLLVARVPKTFHFQYLIPSLFIFFLLFSAILSPFYETAFIFLLSIFFAYTIFMIINSFYIFFKFEKNFAIFLIAPIATFIIHCAYGLGFLNGFFRYLFKKTNTIKMPSKY